MVAGINISKMNSELGSLQNRINFTQIQTAATDAQAQFSALKSTKLGINVGAIEGGFQSLTQEVDNLIEDATQVAGKGIALLADNPPGINLKAAIESSNLTALQGLTGLTTEVTSGINSFTCGLPSPEAIGATLSSVSGKNIDELTSAIESVAPAATAALASSSVFKQVEGFKLNGTSGIFSGFTKSVGLSTSAVNNYLDKGFGQPLKDLVEATNSPVGNIVSQLSQDTGKLIPNAIKKQINGLVDSKSFLGAAEILSPFSNINVFDIETTLSGINTEISANVFQTNAAFAALGESTAKINSLGTNDKSWLGSSTVVKKSGAVTSSKNYSGSNTTTEQGTYEFTIISSMEELEAEIQGASREITEVVIHWTANFIDQMNIGAEDVHKWHLQRGFNGCGYHYIIRRDGSIQRGRPINIEGAHAKDFGHNNYSIGISHVAGYNCSASTPSSQWSKYISGESITAAQFKAQKDFLRAFYNVIPGGQVLGHYQCTTSNKVDPVGDHPSWDVDDYIYSHFGKKNVYQYNNNYGPLSRTQLITARGNQFA
jgi:N-acetylmuramoyl-L-alanine amidase